MLCDKQCDKHRSEAIISLMTGSETEAAKGIEASALTLLFRAAFAFGDTSALLAGTCFRHLQIIESGWNQGNIARAQS